MTAPRIKAYSIEHRGHYYAQPYGNKELSVYNEQGRLFGNARTVTEAKKMIAAKIKVDGPAKKPAPPKMSIERYTAKGKVIRVVLTMSDDELEDLSGSLNAGLHGDRYSTGAKTVRRFLKVVGN